MSVSEQYSMGETEEQDVSQFTPPLRGSRRSRAFFAKADAVGGEMRFIAIPDIPPTESLTGLRPLLFDSPSRGE